MHKCVSVKVRGQPLSIVSQVPSTLPRAHHFPELGLHMCAVTLGFLFDSNIGSRDQNEILMLAW